MTGRNLKRSTYTGQFGMFVVESGDDPGSYDQEVPILLHEWDPRFTEQGGMDIEFRYYSINGKMLGAGEPIRVRQNQRVLFASSMQAPRYTTVWHCQGICFT